eukprot:SAG31_NODE_5382_length_2572_cov_64.320259_1_plen_64_part_00
MSMAERASSRKIYDDTFKCSHQDNLMKYILLRARMVKCCHDWLSYNSCRAILRAPGLDRSSGV